MLAFSSLLPLGWRLRLLPDLLRLRERIRFSVLRRRVGDLDRDRRFELLRGFLGLRSRDRDLSLLKKIKSGSDITNDYRFNSKWSVSRILIENLFPPSPYFY